MLTNIYNVISGSVLALPNHLLDPTKLPMTIDLGGLTAQIESFAGHSGTDLIVRVPDQNVVYTGDLLFSGVYPYCFDQQATISGWRATLRAFSSWDKDTLFVPGHGQICGQEGVTALANIFDDIAAQAEKMYKAGVPVQEAADLYVVPEKFKNFSLGPWGFTIGPVSRNCMRSGGPNNRRARPRPSPFRSRPRAHREADIDRRHNAALQRRPARIARRIAAQRSRGIADLRRIDRSI